MAAIVVTNEIDQPARVVFDYVTDPSRFSEWQSGVVSGEMSSNGALAVGDICRTTRKIGGSDRTSSSKLVHVDPPRTWGVRGVDGPIRAAVDVTVEPLSEERSRLTISVDFQGHGIGKLLVPLVVRREAEKEMPGNLEAVKRNLKG